MRYHFFLHYGWVFQNLGKEAVRTFMHLTVILRTLIKSGNLQYNTLVCWFAGTNDSATKSLTLQVLLFFHNFLQNCFILFFYSFYEFTKIKIKSFECPKSITNYKKNNAWSTSHLSRRTSKPAY